MHITVRLREGLQQQFKHWLTGKHKQGQWMIMKKERGADKCRKCGIVHESKEEMRLIQSGLGGILKFKGYIGRF